MIKECQIYHLLLNIFLYKSVQIHRYIEKENESRVYETALIFFKVPSVVKLKKMTVIFKTLGFRQACL